MDKNTCMQLIRDIYLYLAYGPKKIPAPQFAQAKHEGQTRKYTGEPYFRHCVRVATLVQKQTDDLTLYTAALLHDTLEDTKTTYDELVWHFGERVADLVVELTDKYTHEAFPNCNRKQRKMMEAGRYRNVSEDAKTIKLCDLADNTRDIVEQDPSFAVTYLREKAYLLEQMGH